MPPVTFTRTTARRGGSHGGRSIRPGRRAPSTRALLVVQVSRWDRLKDMAGVMTGFLGGVAAANDGPSRPRRSGRGGGERRPGRGPGPRRVRRRLGGTARRRASAGQPRNPADGRPRRKRHHGERHPAPCHRRGAEEPGGRLRADRGGGDVERQGCRRLGHRRDHRPDSARYRHPAGRPDRSHHVRRRCWPGCSTTQPRSPSWVRGLASTSSRHFVGDKHLVRYAQLIESLVP